MMASHDWMDLLKGHGPVSDSRFETPRPFQSTPALGVRGSDVWDFTQTHKHMGTQGNFVGI